MAYRAERYAARPLDPTSGRGSVYVYLGGAVLFRKDTGSATAHFYASDLSDNVRVVLSYSGSVSVELKQRYKPFGQMAAPLVSPPTLNPSHRFSDLPTTTTTGLTTMGARHYAPDLGRFLSRDPLGFHDHSYAGDNPLSFRDPSGLDATQALRDEILPDYVDYVQPLTIEGVPEVSVSSLTFDVEGNFYGEAVGAIAEVPAASVSEPGELTPVEGVPLSEVAAEATAYGWEPGVTPTAAGQAAETAPAPAAPSGIGTFRIEAVEGRTKLTDTTVFKFSGFAKLLAPLLGRAMTREGETFVGNIKRLVESEARE